MSDALLNLILGIISGIGFTTIINIPRKSILIAAMISGIGFLGYNLLVADDYSKMTAAFISTVVIAVLSEISSRLFKDAATVFIIPAILPLVPGAGMYYAMLAVVEKNYDLAGSLANEVFFMSGAIALALLATSSLMKMIFSIKDSISKKLAS